METSELLKKVRKIEIKTRGLSNQIFSGQYHSAFKGRGMAFSEVREYAYGDDIRNIDWNVTARYNTPFVKVFEEERELTLMLVVDVSASGDFGTHGQSKRSLITELSAVLSFSALNNNDKIGVILFSDRIELFIPPKKGKTHILRIIRELIEFHPQGTGTDIGLALRFLTNAIKKRSIAFLMSDMMGSGYDDPLRIAARKHDMVALRVRDQREDELPNIGLVRLTDAETGVEQWVDTSDAEVRTAFKARALQMDTKSRDLLRRAGVDTTDLYTDRSYVAPLTNLLKRRGARR